MQVAKENPATVTNEKIAKAYSSPPWWYDIRGFFILTFTYRDTLWQQVKFFSKNLGPRHLEVAIGTGTLLYLILIWRRLFRMPPLHISGFDYAEPMLAGARKRFSTYADAESALWSGYGIMELRQADVSNLPYPTNSMDSLNIANAFHCFPDTDAAMAECMRVLKPGADIRMNVLLHPRGLWPIKKLSEAINSWGMKKGILVRPYSQQEVLNCVEKASGIVVYEKVRGNACYVQVRKPSS